MTSSIYPENTGFLRLRVLQIVSACSASTLVVEVSHLTFLVFWVWPRCELFDQNLKLALEVAEKAGTFGPGS